MFLDFVNLITGSLRPPGEAVPGLKYTKLTSLPIAQFRGGSGGGVYRCTPPPPIAPLAVSSASPATRYLSIKAAK